MNTKLVVVVVVVLGPGCAKGLFQTWCMRYFFTTGENKMMIFNLSTLTRLCANFQTPCENFSRVYVKIILKIFLSG